MEIDPIKIIMPSSKEAETQSQVSVPKWFLNLISESDTEEEVLEVISLMRDSKEENLCKDKSINLAKIRLKIISRGTS